jgi:hypothetical protein
MFAVLIMRLSFFTYNQGMSIKPILLTFIFFSGITAASQTPKISGFKLFAGSLYDRGSSITSDSLKNYYFTGAFQNSIFTENLKVSLDCKEVTVNTTAGFIGFLLRFDSAKKINLTINNPQGELYNPVVDSKGNIYTPGSNDYGATSDAFLSKYSPDGQLLWTKLIQSTFSGNSASDVITGIDISKTGKLVISGFSYGDDVVIFDRKMTGPVNFITLLDKDGTIKWVTNFSSELGRGILPVKFDEEENIIAGGDEALSNNGAAVVIAKLDGESGHVIWKKVFIPESRSGPRVRCVSKSGDSYFFGGEFTGDIKIYDTTFTSGGDIDFFILKTDKNGNILWIKQGGGPGKDRIYDLYTLKDGSTFFTGSYSDSMLIDKELSISKGNADVFIGELTNDGSLRWLKKGGSSIANQPVAYEYFYDEYGQSIIVDWKNEIQVVGTTIGSGNFDNINYTAPEDAKQNAFWLSLSEKDTSFAVNYPCAAIIPPAGSFNHITLYPNPFSQSLTIKFPGSYSRDFNLSLFNLLGQKIDTRIIKNANIVTIKDWQSLSAGMYFLKIENADFNHSFKVLKY